MNSNSFNFDLVDTEKPEVVVQKAIKQIDEATRGYVTGNIEEYSGEITSYTKKVGLGVALATFSANTETIDINIQQDLGELDTQKNRYEVYILVKGLQHYKYRIMFLDYKTVSYPVTVVLNERLAEEYSQNKREYTFLIGSMKELENMVDKIINSDTMIKLLQNLINEAIREENKAKI